MKIEKKAKEFDPIIITLETREEAEALKSVMCSISGISIIRNITDTIYEKLGRFGINDTYKERIVQEMIVE